MPVTFKVVKKTGKQKNTDFCYTKKTDCIDKLKEQINADPTKIFNTGNDIYEDDEKKIHIDISYAKGEAANKCDLQLGGRQNRNVMTTVAQIYIEPNLSSSDIDKDSLAKAIISGFEQSRKEVQDAYDDPKRKKDEPIGKFWIEEA